MNGQKGKIRYVLKEDTKYSKALPSMANSIRQLNSYIQDEEEQVRKWKVILSKETKKLREFLQEREQLLKILEDLKLVKKKKTKDISNGINNPSEIVSLNNPTIEIYLREEEFKEVEERDKEKDRLRRELKRRR